MPNIKSAIKRVKVIHERTLRNAAARSALRTSIRKFNETLAGGKVDEAKFALVNAIEKLDKAAGKGILHKNAAARKKSRLTKKLNQLAKTQ
ncbi:MAG: 30S ribosomal protein S20 [Thermincolia bacterium]